MHWVLQQNLFAEAGWDELVATLERFEVPHSVHAVVPFVGELVPPPPVGLTKAICLGSYSMRHVARRHGWLPGVFDLFEQDFVAQRAHWGQHLLNASSVVSRLADARFDAERLFVRPTTDSKSFDGKVFEKAEFEAWRTEICSRPAEECTTSLTADTLVQLAAPVSIHAEYRFWVVRGRVVTRSLYKRAGRLVVSREVDDRIEAFVTARMGEWQPHEAFVIDVCDGPDGLKVLELNTLNAAGFYAADVQRLVLALEDAFG